MSMKQYLGDGVYADFDGYQIKLTTENGINVQNEIWMEPSVVKRFEEYVWNLKKQADQND